MALTPLQADTIRVQNKSGETLPAYGCVQLLEDFGDTVGQTAGTDVTYFACDKPVIGRTGPFAFNGPVDVASDGYAIVKLATTRPVLALLKYDIELDDAWELRLSPVSDQWYLDVGSMYRFGGVFPSFPSPAVGFVLHGFDEVDVILKLDEEITAEMLEYGLTATATIWIDNPDWGPGESGYIETYPPITVSRVVPWDKESPLSTGVLYAARYHGGFLKIFEAVCQ